MWYVNDNIKIMKQLRFPADKRPIFSWK